MKLIVLDLDGTSIGSDNQIGSRLRESVRAAVAAGVSVILATGRMVTSAVPYWLELELGNGPLIAFNGGKVVWMPEQTLWFIQRLNGQSAKMVAEAAMQAGILAQVYIDEQLWVSRFDERVQHYVEKNRIGAQVMPPDELVDWPEPPVKILLQDEPERLDTFRDRITPSLSGYPVRLVKSQPDYLELIPAEVGKSHALAQVAKRLGLTASQVMALGDAENDMDMLIWAGLGVAMGQSPQWVKNAADVVTRPVWDDGAAAAIDYVLGGENPPWI